MVIPTSAFMALAVSIAIGLLCGVYPALCAPRLDPVGTLRYGWRGLPGS